MSPNAHVAVHFSSFTFSPYDAPIAFESHGTAFSPDGGFSNGATVVVTTSVVVVARTGAGVVCGLDDVVEQALKSVMATTSPAKRFTLGKLTGLIERLIGKFRRALLALVQDRVLRRSKTPSNSHRMFT